MVVSEPPPRPRADPRQARHLRRRRTPCPQSRKKLLTAVNLFDVYENEDQLGAGKKSFAVSFQLESDELTLNDKQLDKVMKSIEGCLVKQLGAEVDSAGFVVFVRLLGFVKSNL